MGARVLATIVATIALVCAVAAAATLHRPYEGRSSQDAPVYIGVDLANGPGSPIKTVSFSAGWKAKCADGIQHFGQVVFKRIPLHLHEHGRTGSFHRTLTDPGGGTQSVAGTLTVTSAHGTVSLNAPEVGSVCHTGTISWTAKPL
jgi:hypothetical protein